MGIQIMFSLLCATGKTADGNMGASLIPEQNNCRECVDFA